MNPHDFLENLALVLGVGGLAAVVAHRLRLPAVFGYLVAGMVVGPHLPIPLVADEETIRTLSELGVILLMFTLGLEFRLARLAAVAATAGPAALAETTVMFGLGYATATLGGWTPLEALFAGAMVAISSTTIIARTFDELRVEPRLREIVFGVLVVEDVIAILLIAVLTALAAGGALTVGTVARTGARLGVFLLALVAAGRLVLPRAMRFVTATGRPELTTVAAIGVCFASALLALTFGYSVALGAFIAGSLVAESGEGTQVAHRIEPVRDVFVAIFFVSVGMLLDLGAVRDHWGAVLALSMTVVAGKVVAGSLGVFAAGAGVREAVRAGMSLAQIGEFSFIIAGVGLASGATRPFVFPVAVAVSALTTLATPWMVRVSDPVAQWVDRALPHSLQTWASLYGAWIARLRAPAAPGDAAASPGRLVRPVVARVAALVALVVGAGVELAPVSGWLTSAFGWPIGWSRAAAIAVAGIVAVPVAAACWRTITALADALGRRALPVAAQGLDRALVPRRALVAFLRAAFVLAAAAPVLVALQVFVPQVPTVFAFVALAAALAAIVGHAAVTLYRHAAAGAEVYAMALAQGDRLREGPAAIAATVRRVSAMLPGLADPDPLVLEAASPGVGRTLGELDLRGRTGATVLSVTHADGTSSEGVPGGRLRLTAGDVLVLAGTDEAVAAARRSLGVAVMEEGAPPRPQ